MDLLLERGKDFYHFIQLKSAPHTTQACGTVTGAYHGHLDIDGEQHNDPSGHNTSYLRIRYRLQH